MGGVLDSDATVDAHDSRALIAAALPDRPLRRQPYAHEVAAAVDFRALDVAYENAADRLEALFRDEWLPEQVQVLREAVIEAAEDGAEALAQVRAPVVGADALADVLYDLAVRGAEEAVAELDAQGLSLDVPGEDTLRELVTDHARAVAQQTADGLSLAASRRAVQLLGGGLTPAELADEVADYLEGLEHRWERDQLAGAAQQAVNAGRFAVFEGVEVAAGFYSSELLDAATCGPCRDEDGTEYESVVEARARYPSGGFRECRGGPRCRGTVVVVLAGETEFGSTSVT